MRGKYCIALGLGAAGLGGLLSQVTIGVGFLCTLLMLLGGVLMFYGALYLPSVTARWPRATRMLRRLFYGGCILLLTSFIIVEGIIISQRDSAPYEGNYLVVLGAGVYGTQPSLSLLSRLEAACAYLQEHPEAIAILSGGQGPGEDITEAEAMRRYLTAQGIADQRLYLERSSTNTRENLRNTSTLLVQMGLDPKQVEVAIVTNGFHQYRAQALARQEGLRAVAISAEVPDVPGLAFNCYVREYFAVGKFYWQTLLR